MLYLPKNHAAEMIAHAREEAPNECCGIMAGTGDRAIKLYRARSSEKSHDRYSVDPQDLYRIYREIEDRGWELLVIYHSHTHTEAYPSATDVKLAFWPDSLYVIVSLQGPQPAIRAFRIQDGAISEEKIVLEG